MTTNEIAESEPTKRRQVEPETALTKAEGLIEKHSIDYIPEHERHGKPWKQGPFWFLANFSFFSIALGFIGPSLGLTLGWTVVAGAAGAVFGALAMAFHAAQGPVLGLPQMIQSRAQFGYFGVLIPVVATVFTFIGFSVLQTNVLQTGLSGLYGWNPVLIAIVVSAGAAILSIFGHDWLHIAFRTLFWCSIPFYLILTVAMATGHLGGTAPPEGGFKASAFMAVFATAASYNITLAPDIANFTRYLPTKTKSSHLVIAVVAGTCIALVWLMAMGAWLATRAGATDALVSLSDSGNYVFDHLGTVLAIMSALALIATIGINTYSAMLSVATIMDCFRPTTPTRRTKTISSISIVLVSLLISINLGSDQLTIINDLMVILLYVLVPWSAINLVDFFLVRKGHYAIADIFERDGIYGKWSWRGLSAYFLGLAVQIPFAVLSFYTGPVAQWLGRVDIAFILGMIVPGIYYFCVCRSLNLKTENAAISHSAAVLER